MEPSELLITNLALVERVVAFTCRRNSLSEADAEDFASMVKLRLLEDDYALVRKFEGRSSFATFLSVVVQRMLLDYRIHLWGKWHASAEAKRLGDTAVELEQLLHRDGRTLTEAIAILTGHDPSRTRPSLESLAARLPVRGPKRKLVDLDAASDVAANEEITTRDQLESSERVSKTMCRFIDSLPPDDRLILQLRFESGMTVAQIARSLDLDQKQLYRRIEKRFDEARRELERGGVDADDIRDLIGARGVVLDFDLRKRPIGPSLSSDTSVAAGKEELSR